MTWTEVQTVSELVRVHARRNNWRVWIDPWLLHGDEVLYAVHVGMTVSTPMTLDAAIDYAKTATRD